MLSDSTDSNLTLFSSRPTSLGVENMALGGTILVIVCQLVFAFTMEVESVRKGEVSRVLSEATYQLVPHSQS